MRKQNHQPTLQPPFLAATDVSTPHRNSQMQKQNYQPSPSAEKDMSILNLSSTPAVHSEFFQKFFTKTFLKSHDFSCRTGPPLRSWAPKLFFSMKIVIKIFDFLIWTGPRLRPWASKLICFIQKLLQFNDFASDPSSTPAVNSETYILHSFLFSIYCSFVSVRSPTKMVWM